jgi:hypothetical protein
VESSAADYFRLVLTLLNMLVRALPVPFTAAIIATAMPAAIKPYSIAVAPDSSDRKLKNLRFKFVSIRMVLNRINGRKTYGTESKVL